MKLLKSFLPHLLYIQRERERKKVFKECLKVLKHFIKFYNALSMILKWLRLSEFLKFILDLKYYNFEQNAQEKYS